MHYRCTIFHQVNINKRFAVATNFSCHAQLLTLPVFSLFTLLESTRIDRIFHGEASKQCHNSKLKND